MSFWIGLIIGVFIGDIVAFITVALCFAAKKGDEMGKEEKWQERD